tara:strand:+ start:2036 stop:2242 length:207 start_codon:yes stop_codon:yes gene_type:complete
MVAENIDVETLRDLVIEEWLDAHSDSGHVWNLAQKKLTEALAVVDEGTKVEAYALAYDKWNGWFANAG